MLTLKKIIERNNEPIKYNFDWLVYEHQHNDIVDCKSLAHEVFFGDKFCHTDSYDENEIRWKISDMVWMDIIRMRYTVSKMILEVLAGETTFHDRRKKDGLRLKFYFIDKEGNRIDRHLIL